MTQRRVSHLLLLLAIQLLGAAYFLWFIAKHGYLPAPFVLEKFDTFMDLFNTMYWSDHAGRYTEWKSVYPPLSFLFLKSVKVAFLGSGTLFASQVDLRESAIPIVVVFLLSYLAVPAFVLHARIWCDFSRVEKLVLYLIITLSPPMLFALERGNLIIFTLIFLTPMLSSMGLLRALYVAILINIKPYFVLLLLFYWLKRDIKGLWQGVLLAGGIFLVTGILLDENFLLFFYNIFSFSQNAPPFSTQTALGLPSSVSMYSYVLNLEAIQQTTKYSHILNLKAIAVLIEVMKWSIIAWAMAMLYKSRSLLSDNQIFAVLLVVITNLGISVGGYSLIFYVALLPVFLSMRFAKIYCWLLIMMFAPLDLIPVYSGAFSEQYSYITNSVVNVRWTLGLGGVIKPILNFSFLICLLIELKSYSPTRDVRYSEKPHNLIIVGKSNYILSMLILVTILVTMNYFILYSFPPTEGWWQGYAYLIERGMQPYEDFNLAFPPLFIYFNSLLLKLSNYFIAYRLAGVAEVIVIFFILLKLLSRFYSKNISMVASFIGVALMMNIHLFIPNDYHVFANLLTLAGLFCYVEFSDATSSVRKYLYLIATSSLLVALLFTKQNIGALFIFAVFFVLLYRDYVHRTKYTIHFALVLAVDFAILSVLMHLSPSEFLSLTLKNDAKGSLSTILFNFVLNELNEKYFLWAVLVTLCFSTYRHISNRIIPAWLLIGGGGIALLALAFIHQSPLIPFLIISTLAFLVIELLKYKKSKFGMGLLVIFGCLIYANTLTADITMMYLFPLTAFLVADVLYYVESNYSNKLFITTCLGLVTIFFVSHTRDKYYFPYEWWGAQAGISKATYPLPYDQLKFISVDKSTSAFFTSVKTAIDTYSHGNDVYLFPRIPIFYQLHGKLPPTRNIVQWFDVISQKSMEYELQEIQQARPALVIMLSSSAAAYSIHEELKRQPQMQSLVADYFDSEVSKGKYQLLKYQILNNDIFSSSESAATRLTTTFRVGNPNAFGKTIANINTLPHDISIIKIVTQKGDLVNHDLLAYKLEPFDQIVLQSQAAQIDQIAQIIGAPNERTEIFNALKIYKRTDIER